MGAYLSTPIREKVSEDNSNDTLRYGASSMQGWRAFQEDAHNCCLDFDKETNTSLFAVYDGHGGAEVAQYTSSHFPDYIQSSKLYKENKLAEALEETFLGFDETLTKEEVIKELKILAQAPTDEEEADGQSKEEREALFEEATMPIEELMKRYGGSAPSLAVKGLKNKEEFKSPAVRAKKDTDNEAKDLAGEEDESPIAEEDVKIKLDSKLVNGHSENENNENLEKEQSVKQQKQNGESCSANTPTSSSDSVVDSKIKEIKKDKTEECKEAEPSDSSVKLVSKVKDSDESCNQVSSSSSMPERSAPAPSSGGSSRMGSNEVVESSAASADSSATPAGGSAGSSGSKVVSSGNSAVTSASSAVTSGSSAVSSGNSAVSSGSSAVSSGSSAVSSGNSAGGSGDATEQPGSSTGRTRKVRKGVIPEEGEDESSYDEDSEEDSDGDEDEWQTESEEEDDEEETEGDMGKMFSRWQNEADDDDDDDDEVMCGGEEPGTDSGCTAVVAVLRGKQLYVANAGDSRCVVCRSGKAVDMSLDHKPEDEPEISRIHKAGGRVTNEGRVNGGLNLSRAIGDHCYKQNSELGAREQMITALPDVRCMTLEEHDEFMVLACDGIWNVMTSQDVVNFVSERLKAGVTNYSSICEEMFDFCLAPDTRGDGTGCDNMTCIIVGFDQLHKKLDSASGATKRRASTDAGADDKSEKSPDTKRAKPDSTEQD